MAMTNPEKTMFIFISVVAAVFVLCVAAVLLLVDANAYKSRLEAAASAALGMDVRIGGQLRIALFPGLLVTAEDVHIRNMEKSVVSAKEVTLGFELLPLLRNEFLMTNISLVHPEITIERNAGGKYNFEKPQTAAAILPSGDLPQISLSGGMLHYLDRKTGKGFEAAACKAEVRNLQYADEESTFPARQLSFAADIACANIQARDIAVSGLRLSVTGKKGVFDFKSVKMNIFGGRGTGSIRADYSGAMPAYQIHYSLPQLRIEEFLKTQSPQKIAEGPMDFSVNLSMQGKTASELKRSASGDASLRGKNLTLNGHDLDLEFTRFEASQNFNLVDVGAYFFAGPVGLAVTKGYDFAKVLKGSGGASAIRTFVSQWKIESGVLHAQDVAMATSAHRVAVLGGLDLANAEFVDVAVALIDSKGCAEVEQKIRGSFRKPVIEQPNILKSLAGPAIKLLKKGRKLLPGGECNVIYTGSVASPN